MNKKELEICFSNEYIRKLLKREEIRKRILKINKPKIKIEI
jgi:hypothetical protein